MQDDNITYDMVSTVKKPPAPSSKAIINFDVIKKSNVEEKLENNETGDENNTSGIPNPGTNTQLIQLVN